MGRAKEAADRIRSEIPIVQVLYEYGYLVNPDGADREQQFPCDLHGDGSDNRPSARAYPDSASFHCFACGRSRDAITLVREKEGLDFWPAVKKLEASYNLPALPWSGDGDFRKKVFRDLEESLKKSRGMSTDQKCQRIESLICNAYFEDQISPLVCAEFWSMYDKVRYYQSQKSHQSQVLSGLLDTILERILKTIKGED